MGGKLLNGERVTPGKASVIVDKFKKQYESFIERSLVCGSLRRGKDDAGDIDLVIQVAADKRLLFNIHVQKDYNVPWSYVRKTILIDDVQLEVHVCLKEYWGAMILYATGSGGYNAGLRLHAAQKGLKLNRYGLWSKDLRIAGGTEEEIYTMLNKVFIRPEDRR